MLKEVRRIEYKKLNKRGFVGPLNTVVGVMLGIFVVAAILVGLQSFKTSIVDPANVTSAFTNATQNGLTSGLNFTAQLPTVGTLLGVGLIIFAVVGFAGYAMTKRQ